MRSLLRLAGSWLVVLLAIPTLAAGEQWLHVRVEERGAQGENVRVDLPLGVIEGMLPLIESEVLDEGHGRLDGVDLRQLAAALRESPDGAIISVTSDDENVRVAKEGDFLVVRADQSASGASERVRVRLPLAVLDALVGGEPDRLDLAAALRALGAHAGEALVDVESDDERVRIWIDSTESGDREPRDGR